MRVVIVTQLAARTRYWEAALPMFRDHGIEPVLATLATRGPLHDALLELGVAAYALDGNGSGGYARATSSLRRLLADPHDLVHAHETIPALVAAAAGVRRRAPTVYHRHHGASTPRHRPFSMSAAGLSTLTVAVSNYAGRRALAEGWLRPDRLRVAYNGVPKPRAVHGAEIAHLRARLGVSARTPLVVCIGRLRAEKGQTTLIAAMAMLPGVHLALVGSGREEEALRRQAAGDARIHFAGHRDDIAPWLAAADVVAVPSHHEAFGLAATEALAAGKPVVATEADALPEILRQGVSAVLVPPGQAVPMAEAISAVLEDAALRSKLAQEARKDYTARFTVGAMVRRWADIYRDAQDST